MLGDTILAQCSPAGVGERAVLRLSGPRAFEAAALVFEPAVERRRCQLEGAVRVRGGAVEALLLAMPSPRSFTGEDTVELHVPGSPLLCAQLLEGLLARGTELGLREAMPGEFTARACQNGRLDLLQAEGILMLLHSADRRAAQAAVPWLRGGLSDAVGEVRRALQDALALLESGLDFTDGETGEVPRGELTRYLDAASRRVASLRASLPAAAPGGEVLLLGVANAGKSSLCNALAGREVVLVDALAGTTRDALRVELGCGVTLWDAPGDLEDADGVDAASLRLRDRLAGRAGGVLVVLDATAPRVPKLALDRALPLFGVVYAKADLVEPVPAVPPELRARLEQAGAAVFVTSAVDRRGLPELEAWLQRTARRGQVDAGGPLRAAFARIGEAILRAAGSLECAEIAALELQTGLRALDGVDGHHSPDQLLDRIHQRFCLGK